MGLLNAINRASDWYNNWYDTNILPGRIKGDFPKCEFCGQREYAVGAQTLYNSRVMEQRVRARVRCKVCGMGYQASRLPSSRKWTFSSST